MEERERERERGHTERERKGEREGERERDNIILLSGLRTITTGVNIQTIRILMDPMTDLNSVF